MGTRHSGRVCVCVCVCVCMYNYMYACMFVCASVTLLRMCIEVQIPGGLELPFYSLLPLRWK